MRAIILTTNPTNKERPISRDLPRWLQKDYEVGGKPVGWSLAWNCPGWEQIAPGDFFLFLLQGKRDKGIIGFGNVCTVASPGEFSVTREEGRFIKIRFTALINPFENPNLILGRDRLLAYGFNQFYRIRQSGLEIELAAAYKVRDMFLAHQQRSKILL
jgi:hypothetical protein